MSEQRGHTPKRSRSNWLGYSPAQERLVRWIVAGMVVVGVCFLAGVTLYSLQYFLPAPFPEVPRTSLPSPTDIEPTLTMTPTVSPEPQRPVEQVTVTPTADLQATATAACGLFQTQFPGTPCPPTAVPGIEATATKACATFRERFPGTPCP